MLVAFVLRIHLPSSFRQFDVLFKSDWYYLVMSVADPESSILKTPEWLEVLENKRKRPHKLAHEIGAGAPCLVCKDRCKGLNLHFWR